MSYFSVYQNLKHHPQHSYCDNLELFKKIRINYYRTTHTVTSAEITNVFVLDYQKQLIEKINIHTTLERLAKINPEIVIITASCNRIAQLQNLYQSLQVQNFKGRLGWLIVDNSSSHDAKQYISDLMLSNPWVVNFNYNFPLGYAAPARNRGLGIVQLAGKYCSRLKFFWVIDSDDYLHNTSVIKELFETAKRHDSLLTHGYTVCALQDTDGRLIESGTIPRNLNSKFPIVPSLKEEFDCGPQNLSGILDISYLPYFYYINEFTMEDDALNQKIMAYCLNKKRKIIGFEYPCLVKRFHFESMSTKNSQRGNPDFKMKLGEHTVIGMRAKAVLGLLALRDYFTVENI